MLRLRYLAVLVLVGGLVAACGDDEDARSYVALGDSFTAAPLMGRPDGTDGCFRSRNNYPHQLAERLDLDLDDVSCSAATTANVESEQTTPQGSRLDPQIDAVDADTDLVTISLGANDFDLVGRVILTCVQLSAAAAGAPSPCRDTDLAAGAASAEGVMPQLGERLRTMYAAVQEKAPGARVIAVGYPRMFPADGTCESLPISAADAAWGRGIIERVNETMQAAAEASGVEYVDTQTPSEGHDICGDVPWVAGTKVISGRAAQPFHPYVEEQRMVADLLARRVGDGT